jgi:TP901 family phage tail tape measure protein
MDGKIVRKVGEKMANNETKITFKAFNQEFNKALDEMKGKSATLRKEFVLQSNQLKHTGTETDKLNTKLKFLSQEHEIAKQKVQATQQQLDRAKQVFGENSKEVDRLARQLLDTQIAEQKLANQIIETNGKLKDQATQATKTGKSMAEIGDKMQDAGGRMQSTGQEIATSFGATSVAIGAALGVSVKKSMDFEAQLDRVGAIADATESELDSLRQSALELGASTSKSATEIAQGQENLAAMGFTAKEIIGAMPGVISAAEASGSDMAQTAEVMASTLNIFGMEASKATDVADILAKTANISAADLTDMQYALKYAGPPAAALGVSLEELSASIGIMTDAGMEGEQAGTSLRSALFSLLEPSVDNAKMMETMGIRITDANNDFVGMSQLIENISTSMEGMTDTQKAANLASLVGKEAVSGMLNLMAAGPDQIDKMTFSLENSAGASAEAAAKMKDNLKGSLEELSGAAETAQISIGDALAPALRTIAGVVQSLTEKFNSLSPGAQKFIAVGLAVAAVVTGLIATIGVIIAVAGTAVTGFGAIITAMGGTAAVTGALGTAFTVLTGPVGLIIAAIVALIAIFVTLYKKNEDFRNKVQQIWNQIKQSFKTSLDFIMNIVRSIMSSVMIFFRDILAKIQGFWKENGTQIMAVVKLYFGLIFEYIKHVLNTIKAVFQMVWPIISGVIKVVWASIQLTIKNAIDIILGSIQFFLKIFKGDWKGAFETIKQTAMNIMNNVKETFTRLDLKQIGKDIINGLIKGIKTMVTGAAKAAKNVAQSISNAVTDFFKIKSPSRLMMTAGGHVVQGLANGMKNNKSAEKSAKEKAAEINKRFKEELDKSKDNFKLGKIDTKEYIASLNAVKTVYAKLPEQFRTVDLEIQKAQKIAAEESKKATQKKIDNEKAVIDKKKDFGQLSLEEELKRWKNIIAMTKKGSEERIEAEKNVYRVKEEIRKRDFEKGKAAIDDLVKYNGITLGQQLDALRDLHSKYKKGTDEWIEIDRRIADTKIAIHAELKNINNEYLKNVQDVNSKLIEEEQKLNDAYKQTLADRTSTLTNFAGIFDEIKPKEDALSGTQLLNNLQSQVSAFTSWQGGLSSLKARGIDEGLLNELQALGPKSQQEIQALTTLSSVELEKYTELWKTKHKLAAEQAAKELEPLKKETQNKINELKKQAEVDLESYKQLWIQKTTELRSGVEDAFDPVKANMRQIGEDALRGLMDGLKNMEGPLTKVAKTIASGINTTMKSALKIKSPSRVLMKIGQFAGEGLAVGIESMKGAVARASEMLSQYSLPILQAGGFETEQIRKSLEVNLASQPMYFTFVSELDGYEVARNQYEYIDGMMTTKYQNNMLTNGVRER